MRCRLSLGPEAASLTARTGVPGLRGWTLTVLFFLLPIATYWPATFHEYGLRDDYSNLREAHETPGVVLKFCASTARPIYGWLLQASYGRISSVRNLRWMRFSAVLLLGTISLVMFRSLRALGWSSGSSICCAVLLALVPSAQVIASWAVGWPYAASALLAIAGFFSAERAVGLHGRSSVAREMAQWSFTLCLMAVSILIYQSSALFYTAPLAAALIAQRQRDFGQTSRWLGVHLAVVCISLALTYSIMDALYAEGWFIKSGRVAFEHDWLAKLAWFLSDALPNALSMFVLNDDNHRDWSWYLACAGLAGVLLAAGAVVEWRRHGTARGIVWLLGLTGLPVFALGISLVASERYATYRTILAMTAVLLCFLVASVRALTDGWNRESRQILAIMVMGLAFATAQRHAYALIAVPQGNEWQLILEGARKVSLDSPVRPRVFAIASSPVDMSTATIYHDEFGSLSSNSEWVPREMFKRAMHDLHPDVQDVDTRYEFAGGYMLPPGERYDVTIDLHRLRRFFIDD